jgi:hypothetical protein
MNIGIFISARLPLEGGGYTLSKDLFDQLIQSSTGKKLFFIIRNNTNSYFLKKIKKNKFKYIITKESKLIIFIKCFLYQFLKRNIFRNKIDIFLEKNFVKCVIFLSSENFYPLKVPYISTIWDIQHYTNPNFQETGSFFIRIYRYLVTKIFIQNSSKIISGTNVGINEIIKYYQIKKNFFYKLSHPTPKVFLNKNKSIEIIRLFKKKPFFIYPANFWEHKNHFFLLQAIKEINLSHKNKINIVLVGNPKNLGYHKKIKNYIETNNLNNNVKLLSFVSVSKLIKLYDSSSGLIYTSTSGPENLPPLEAFARGKNVIIGNYPGSIEQLKDNANYFDLKNLRSLKKKILNFNSVDKIQLKKYAKSKDTKIYIERLFYLIEKDFND